MLDMHNVDPSRVYAMGYSNGGGFVYDLACRLNDKVTGVGAVARTMYAESYDECVVTHPTPVVTILGTNDFISSYDGITYDGTLYYHSAEATHDLWIDQNGLLPQAEVSTVPDLNPSDNTSVELYQWRDEQNCRELAHYKVNGGDHDWPGTFGNMDIVSHDVIWAHLKEFDMDGRMSCACRCNTLPFPCGMVAVSQSRHRSGCVGHEPIDDQCRGVSHLQLDRAMCEARTNHLTKHLHRPCNAALRLALADGGDAHKTVCDSVKNWKV